jgi:hypothetical protein
MIRGRCGAVLGANYLTCEIAQLQGDVEQKILSAVVDDIGVAEVTPVILATAIARPPARVPRAAQSTGRSCTLRRTVAE